MSLLDMGGASLKGLSQASVDSHDCITDITAQAQEHLLLNDGILFLFTFYTSS